jgi:hypothetical protein
MSGIPLYGNRPLGIARPGEWCRLVQSRRNRTSLLIQDFTKPIQELIDFYLQFQWFVFAISGEIIDTANRR